MARIGTIIKECKKHGTTTFALYAYDNGYKNSVCLECVREKREERRKNPKKYAHDKAYTKKWLAKNKDHVKELNSKYIRNKKFQRLMGTLDFIAENEEWILNILYKLESKFDLQDVEEHCNRFNVRSKEKVYEFIYNNKFSELKSFLAWRHSNLVKYHHGVRGNYSEIPETFKERIRAEYKTKALTEATKKMEELCKTV